MGKFEIGDRVQRYRGGNTYGMSEGDFGVVVGFDDDGDVKVRSEKNDEIHVNYPTDLRLIERKSINLFMATLKSIWRNLNASEPEKSFRKAGIVNDNGEFTSEGYEIFRSYLLKRFGDDFKKEVVDGLIHEMQMGDSNKL